MFGPRWYQAEAIDAVIDFLLNHDGNPLVAMPTGTGKSLVIAGLIYSARLRYPGTKCMMLTHVKELVSQNANALYSVDPFAPIGICSAGLNRKETNMPISYGSVQSVVGCVEEFGFVDILFIDEVQMLSPKEGTRYQIVIAALLRANPKLRIVGLSATIFRLGQGYITEGDLFDVVVYDLTGVEPFNRLVVEGYLAPLIPRSTQTTFDLTGVKMSGGDYVQSQLQAAVDKNDITYAAVDEMMTLGADRRAWLVFATGIEHAKNIAEMMSARGIECEAVHSKMTGKERDELIAAFKRGDLQAVINNNVLTTGFDYPAIDLIGVLRPTMSASLWVQMLGRGTRPCEGKTNCQVLDFARNTLKLGPINDPVIPSKPGQKRKGVAPVKTCPHCGTFNHTRAPFCVGCGAEFTFTVGIQAQAGTEELIRGEQPVFEEIKVDRVLYTKHEKRERTPTLRVNYICGLRMFSKWVPLQHPMPACNMARHWWNQRTTTPPPETIDAALLAIGTLEKPRAIRVITNRRYPEIVGEIFERPWTKGTVS